MINSHAVIAHDFDSGAAIQQWTVNDGMAVRDDSDCLCAVDIGRGLQWANFEAPL